MTTKTQNSKILELERDLLFKRKIKKVNKKHFDTGNSITLKYDDGLNDYTHQNCFEDESREKSPELSYPASLQFSNGSYFVDSSDSSHDNSEEENDSGNRYYVKQEEDEDSNSRSAENYIVSGRRSGDEDESTFSNRSHTVYEDESSNNESSGGEYAVESSFEDDIKSILSGQKKYNEEQKQLTSTAQSIRTDSDNEYSNESSKVTDNHNNGLRSQEINNPHAIFDSLAQSFGNATSYDLGSFDLDKSFTEIEEAIAKTEQSSEKKPDIARNSDKTVLETNKSDPSPINRNPAPQKNDCNVVTPVISQNDTTQQLSLDALDISEDFALINEFISNNNIQNVPSNLAFQHDLDHVCETDQYNQTLNITNGSFALAVVPELRDLLSYLQIGYDTFQPVENRYFHRLKELLVFHNILNPNDILDSSNFGNKVKDFQRTKMNQSSPDGIPGENTLFELQKGWANTRGLALVRSGIRNDAYNGSQIPFVMRSDALLKYDQLYDQIHNQGGVITSAGSFRELSASVSSGRSSTSMHYTGLAFDLHTSSGLQNTTGNPYLLERSGANRWQLWNKVLAPHGNMQSLNSQIYNSGSKTITPVALSERVIDFKAIANNNGFKDIGNRSCFPGEYMCAEWWHFQCEDVLVPYLSQFGTELLTIYDESQLTVHPNIWQNRKKIFKKDWF